GACRCPSNYLQDIDLARPALKFGLELVYLLFDFVNVLLDQPRSRPLTAAMVEEEGCFAGIERGPDVVADQSFGGSPVFFENGEFPLRVNLAEEMQPSGRQRQLCRNFGDLSAPQ